MKSRLELFQEESLKTGLAPEERTALRNSLIAYIDKNPLKERSGLVHTLFSPFSGFTRIGMASAFVLFFVSSMAVAAEGSIPGDLLYPVKVRGTEKIRSAFTYSHKGKADLEASLAARRLEEAEALQAQSRLSSEMKASVVSAFTQHTHALDVHVKELTAQEQTEDVKNITTHFEALLQAHAKILPVLSLTGGATGGETQ